MSTIVIRGPFTEADVAAIVALVARIEARRPDETFEVFIDAPEQQGDVDTLIDRINPPRPGYTRTVSYWKTDPEEDQ